MKITAKRFSANTRTAFITYGLVTAFFLIMTLLNAVGATSSLLRGQLVPICAYIIMAVSLNLTVGVLGELSLGHAGFMSVGAFTGAVIAASLKNAIPSGGVRLLIAIVASAIVAGIAGVLIGIPVLRLKGDYLAIVTLAFGEIIKGIVNNLYIGLDELGLHIRLVTDDTLVLSSAGKMIIDGPMGVSGNEKLSSFTAGFILVMVCLVIIYNFIDSRDGRAVLAVRDNAIAAESVGINVTRYKLLAFTISAMMAGMAGTLFAMNYSTVVATKFDFNTSILVLVFVVLGGLGNIRGSVIAAALLTVLPELLRKFSDYRMLIYAIILILSMLIANNPNLSQFFADLGKKLKKHFVMNRKGGKANV